MRRAVTASSNGELEEKNVEEHARHARASGAGEPVRMRSSANDYAKSANAR
jgi:hypothetical protein